MGSRKRPFYSELYRVIAIFNYKWGYMSGQNKIEKANKLLVNFLSAHPEIDFNLWVTTMWTTIAQAYFDNGTTYEQFVADVNEMLKHAKVAFEE